MASVFSYYTPSFDFPGDRDDHLTQSPRAIDCSRSPHHILDLGSTVKLIRLFTATIGNQHTCNAMHPFAEPRQLTPTCPG